MSLALDAVLRAAGHGRGRAVALRVRHSAWTRAELDARADAGVAPGEPSHVRVSNEAADLAALMGAWRAGAVVVPVHRRTPSVAGEAITRVGAVPTMMRALGDTPADPRLPLALRDVLIGGEPLGTPLAGAIEARFPGARLVDTYGLTETATCDLFDFPEDSVRAIVLSGAGIVTMLLPWMTGPKQAKDIILTGADALRMGLVSRVVPPGTHVDAALAVARGIALMDPVLVRETRKAINRSYEIQGMRAVIAWRDARFDKARAR